MKRNILKSALAISMASMSINAALAGNQDTQMDVLIIESIATTTTVSDKSDMILVDASSGAVTVNLPDVSSYKGKVYEIKKTDSSFINVVTIDPFSTDTIGGNSTTTLNTQGESIKVVYDKANNNWEIVQRTIPSKWATYACAGTWTTNTTYTCKWRRVGDSIQIVFDVFLTGVPSSGSLFIDLPSISATYLTVDAGKVLNTCNYGILTGQANGVGAVTKFQGAARINTGASTTAFQPMTSLDLAISPTVPNTFNNGDEIRGSFFNLPISGWNE